METDKADELTADQLMAKLACVLQEYPLYRPFRYKGHGAHGMYVGGGKFAELPKQISLHCTDPRCKKVQQWQVNKSSVTLGDGFRDCRYTCRNCGSAQISYFFTWFETEDGGFFVKVGQYPPLSHEPPRDLERRFDREDLDFYKKALSCRNFSYGLGALTYLRRVVENRVNDLLDRLTAFAKHEGADSELLDEVERAKQSQRFENKLDVANKLIPDRLKRGGFNPISALHDLASAGIHREPEEECIDIFDKAKTSFEYLFSQLEHEALSREEYEGALRELERKARDRKLPKTPPKNP